MPIPFKDSSEVASLGSAGYLRFIEEDGGSALHGALFLVNGRSEPLDFCFSRIEMPAPFLWRPGEARRFAVRTLCEALFAACPTQPLLLLARAEEVSPLVFSEDLHVSIPVTRIASGLHGLSVQAHSEVSEALGEEIHAFWSGQPLPADSPERRLFAALNGKGGILEPFERAALGLQEASSTR